MKKRRMNTLNNNQASIHQEKTKKKFTFRRGCGLVVTIIVVFIIGNIAYGNIFKGKFVYEDAGKNIFSIKYPKKYHTWPLNTGTNTNDGKVDQLVIVKDCLVFDLILHPDCAYDAALNMSIYKKNGTYFFTTPEEYSQYKQNEENAWGGGTYWDQYKCDKKASFQLCDFTDAGKKVIFTKNYMIEITTDNLNSEEIITKDKKNRKIDTDYMLSTLTFVE